MISLERVGQIWNYFKKGRNEIGLIISLYGTILAYSIKFDTNFTLMQYVWFSVAFFIGCIVLGVFLAEKIEPENSRISPYAQDNIQSTIHLQDSLKHFYQGDVEKALQEMNKAQALREKWQR